MYPHMHQNGSGFKGIRIFAETQKALVFPLKKLYFQFGRLAKPGIPVSCGREIENLDQPCLQEFTRFTWPRQVENS